MANQQVLESGDTWNAGLYDTRHAFVWKSGADILEWLQPRAGEKILDVGCGTGHLTAQIASSGASVIALDASPAMLQKARDENPQIHWLQGDARHFSLSDLDLGTPLDAIFSNATLHWVRPPQEFLACAFEVLKPGGRLVAEFGGRGNVERVLSSIELGLKAVNVAADVRHNYFPSVGEYASLCENAGLQVLKAELFSRPTPLQGDFGLRGWAQMFRSEAVESVPESERERFFEATEDAARPHLRDENGWFADYWRLRVFAVKR